jgi:hypothetical protein
MTWNEENQEILKKLKEEPWKSRLIKKRIISPDERFFKRFILNTINLKHTFKSCNRRVKYCTF